jgi:RND superfamily putative drug exporter
MKLNPESLSAITSRHPWRTLGAWVLVIALMGYLSATFLGDVLTDDMAFTNRPESARALEVVQARFGGAGEAETEFLVVGSESRRWNNDYAAYVQDLKAGVEALGPSVVAGPVITYADAQAMEAALFTPDGHGALLVLQIRSDPEAVIERLRRPTAAAVPAGFQAQVLTPAELAQLSGGAASGTAAADPPEAFVLVSHPVAVRGNLQFLQAVRSVEAAVIREGGSDLLAPPYSGYDASLQSQALISTDRRTTLLTVPLAEQSEAIVHDLREVAERNSNGTYTVQVAGQAALFTDFMKVAEEDMRTSEGIGLMVALIVLVVVFGSIVAAILPIFMGLFAIAVAMGLVALVGQIWNFNLFVQNMITMIGLAVGIDYSLFIVSRYREERKKGYEKLDAIRRSGATASRAVFFSGATVILALLGMLIIPVSMFRSLAGGAALVTFAAIAASMTLLPGILGLLGDRVNWPRLSRRARVETSHDPQGGFWDRVTRRVMAAPVVFLVASVLVLGTLGAFYFQLHRGTSQNVSALPDGMPSKTAFTTLMQEFGTGGASEPTQIVVTGDVSSSAARAAMNDLERGIVANDTFSKQVSVAPSKDGTAFLVQAYLAGDPSTDAAFEGIRELRTSIVPGAFDGVPGVEVLVGGNTAMFVDFLEIVDSYQFVVLGFVLALSFMLLTVVFRSIVVPIKAIAMNLLSVAAAYGAVTLVFQKGIGIGVFNALGFSFDRVEAIEAWLPLFLFSILFGLSMDYHVFLLTRIREEYDKTGDNTEAVAYGLRTTAGIITGAALIMVAVFMDATIVRTLLVPASMRLLGDWNWYLPTWLRWLPRLNVEGGEAPAPVEALATEPVPVVAPAREPTPR